MTTTTTTLFASTTTLFSSSSSSKNWRRPRKGGCVSFAPKSRRRREGAVVLAKKAMEETTKDEGENDDDDDDDDDELEHAFVTAARRGGGRVANASTSEKDDEDDDVKIQIPTVHPRKEDAKTADVETLRSVPLIEELYETVVNPVNKLEPEMRKLTSAELRAKTLEFRARLSLGETLEDVLVEAFAVVREASRRELGLRHFDVQLVGGALLHKGVVAEMATGEGKTLVATLPAYLNALSRRGVHIVTVNDYLAERDGLMTAKIHGALGLSVGYVLSEDSPEERRKSYDCDITYVTNQEIGFDYLRDNMATNVDELVVMTRPLNFAIVDEVDSVLIDEGRNPLLITGPSDMDEGPRYVAAAKIAEGLVEGRDYKADRKEKTIEMTDEGMTNAEILLDVKDLWDPVDPWGKYVILAIKAKALFIRDVDYIVRDDQVIIVDPGTGRVQMNRRWNDNLHQAVEAKEQVEIHSENAIIASVSYQCFFKLYKKLSGMTGTATTETEEFEVIYNLRVIVVPKHRPNARVDEPTAMFRDAMTRWNAVANVIVSCHYEGRPVLVGTTSVEDSETLSMLLDEYLWRAPDDTVVKGVAHNLLNARPQYAAKEAETIAQAGRLGAVTIATNMAGRGTDILLGGNAEGLARRAMKEHLFEALGLGEVLKEERETAFQSVSESLAMVDLSDTPAQIALEQARLIATAACENAGPMRLETANEMLVRSVEKAGEKIRREEQKKQRLLLTGWEAQGINMEEDDDIDDEKEKKRVPFEVAIDFAAEQTLRETARLCKLESQEVVRRGGLQVVGTALHESRRIDRQLRGRAGRQGDPGSTVFCLSLDDEMIRTYSPAMSKQSGAWDFAGLAPEEPMYGTLVDVQLEGIQKNIEDYLSAGRQSTFDADRVLDSQRNAVYELRRMVLVGGQQTLRERLFRYVDSIVDNYCVAANVSGSTPVKNWNIELLMDLLREVFAGRKDRFRMTNKEPVSPHPHYLPGVSAADLKDALLHLDDRNGSRTLPEPRRMPPVDANPVAVRASISGVNLAYADGSGLAGGLEKTDSSGSVADTEPEAEKEAIAERLKRRLERPKGENSSPNVVKAFSSGRHAKKARQLRAYLSEAAIQQYLDRFARLSRLDYIREELEDVERLWVLRAIDERYKQHLVHMSSLKDSVQVRAFGHLDPKEEFKIDGAKAFVDCVSDIRIDALRNIFFFVGASIEPTTEYETVPATNNDGSGDDDDNASGYDPDEDLMRELTEEEREKVRSFLARAKENGISVTESEDGFGDWTGSSGEDDDADADEDEDSI